MQNAAKQNYSSLVASNDTRPGNKVEVDIIFNAP